MDAGNTPELLAGQVLDKMPDVENTDFYCPQRILWLDKKTDLLITIGIETKIKKPRLMRLSNTRDLLKENLLRVIELQLPPYAFENEQEIPKRSTDVRDRAWGIISPLTRDEIIPNVYLPGKRGFLIAKRAAELGLDPKQVYRPLYRYWAYGSSEDALLGRFDLCGPTGRKQAPGTKKRGPRPDRVIRNNNDEKLLGPATADCKDLAIKGISKFLVAGVTKKKAWEDTKKTFFNQGEIIFGGRRTPIPPEPHQALTYWQFWKITQDLDVDLNLTKKNISTQTWNLKHRGVLGSSRQGLFGPGARFEIDATVVDVYLVSVFNRAWVIGRPVLYVVVDTFSRMVVGFYLGLEGPSWEGARQALFNAFTSKVDFCRRYGLEIEEYVWPCHHLPHIVEGDNLEMKSKASDALAKSLGIKVQNAVVCRGDWKPNVEQQFNLINGHTVHFLPGALNPRLDEVYRRNCRLDACLTLNDLTRILIRRLIQYNWSAYRADALPEEMLGENLTDATPISVWEWGLEHLTGGAKSIAKQKIWTKLLPSAIAPIHHNGIYFAGRHYSCERAVREEWFARVRTHGRVEHIEIRHVPDWPEYIWILNHQNREWEPCALLDRDEHYRLARLEEMMDRAKLLSQAKEERASQNRQAFAVFDTDCDDIVDSAKKAAAKAKEGMSKTEKTSNVASNRAFEKTAGAVERAREAAESYCNKPPKNNVVELRPEMRGHDPLDDLWKL